jgi:ectoine hydroxylase-related dioxygenase (phytanoyl-CoA dioxygenase family)
MLEKQITGKKNWLLIDKDYLSRIDDKKRALEVPAGSLVLWDSRTFHQNQYGKAGASEAGAGPGEAGAGEAGAGEERIVQYVSFLPKKNPQNTSAQQKKRLKYYTERRTTSHWSYPLNVNGLQPQAYGNPDMLIDYKKLTPPNLSDLEEKIKLLL